MPDKHRSVISLPQEKENYYDFGFKGERNITPNGQVFSANFQMLLTSLETLVIEVDINLLLIQPLPMLIEFIKFTF